MCTAQILLLAIKAAKPTVYPLRCWVVSLPGERSKPMSVCLLRGPSLCQFACWEVRAYVSVPGERSKPMSVCLVRGPNYIQPTPYTAGLSVCLLRGPSLRVLAVQHTSLYSLKSRIKTSVGTTFKFYSHLDGWMHSMFCPVYNDYRWQTWQILSFLCLQQIEGSPPPPPQQMEIIQTVEIKVYQISFPLLIGGLQCWGIDRCQMGKRSEGNNNINCHQFSIQLKKIRLQLLSPSYLVTHILSYADTEAHTHM